MKKLINFVFLLPLSVIGQSLISSGQGILEIDNTKLPTINFYLDTLSKTPSKTVTIILKEGEYSIKNEVNVLKWFKPEQMYLENDIFILRVDTIIGKWLKVYIDNENSIKLWTKLENDKKYYNWIKFFKTKVTNISKGISNIEIKQTDSESSKTLKKIEEEDCFEIIEVKGDWLKIKTHSLLECSTSKKPIKVGWLKWRKNNKLTISFGLSC